MRASVAVLVALLVAGAALAQMGPEMGMGGMGMGMGMAPPAVLDVGPVWSPTGTQVAFSRVNATTQGKAWVASSAMGGGMGMGGMQGGMMGPGGMMGAGGMMGGGGRADLSLEGLFEVPATGGNAKKVVQGRAIIQDSAGKLIAYTFQGAGGGGYQDWGIYGISFGGSGKARWYPANLPWVRLSPKGDLFAIPYDKAKAIVFFPAKANTQQNAGYVLAENRTTPVAWVASGDGIWLVHNDAPPRPAGMMGGGMMGGGMMGGGMMGPEMGGMGGMGMMGGMAQNYSIAIGKKDQSVTPVVKKVGKESHAVSIPGSTDIAVNLSSGQGAGAQAQPWPGPKRGVYIYDRKGNEKRKLTGERAIVMGASPDGKYIAFMWGDKLPLSLSVAPVDGRPVRRVAHNLVGVVGGCKPFAWSADSKSLAYGAEDETANGVFAVNVETGRTVRLSSAPSTKVAAPARSAGGGGR